MNNLKTAICILIWIIILATASYASSYPVPDSLMQAKYNTVQAADIIYQVNAERAKYGLSPVNISEELTAAAYIRAQELPDIFSHTRPDSTAWYTVSPYARAENIARGYNTTDKAMAAWLTSDGHRRNILNGNYNSIGVCAYEYNGIMYWVQIFGA